jgi:hypothetical protein
MRIVELTGTTFTRPNDTTAYASGDLVANSTTAGSVVPITFRLVYGRGLMIHRAGLSKSTASVTNAAFRLHIYKDSPTVANGDNGAWSSISGKYQGSIDLAAPGTAFSNDFQSYGVYVNNSVYAPLYITADADMRVYGLLEARGAYTPGAQETFTPSLIGQAYA